MKRIIRDFWTGMAVIMVAFGVLSLLDLLAYVAYFHDFEKRMLPILVWLILVPLHVDYLKRTLTSDEP